MGMKTANIVDLPDQEVTTMEETETDRQRQWRKAAVNEARAGNDFGAALFTLVSLPSEAEVAEALREVSEEAKETPGA